MLRADEARHIVIAEEGIDEGISVDHAHCQVPGKPHETGEGDPPGPAQCHDIFEREGSPEDHPKPYDERWKSEADRALRKERETAEDIGGDIFLSKKGNEGDGEREGQRRIRHRAPGKDDDLQRGGRDEGAVERSLLTQQLSHRQVEVGREQRTHQDRRETGTRGRDSKESEGDRFQPIEKRRLIVPEFAIDAGRQPVACREHFLRCLAVDGLIWVEQRNETGKSAVEGETEKEK